MKKRIMIALCCLVLLVQLLPIVPMAETVDAGIPAYNSDIYYCREQLKTLKNSDALLFAYDNIVAGIDACAEEIVISNGQYKLSLDEFEMVLEATRRDHTEQFWMGTTYTPYTDYSETVVEKIVPTYLMTGAALQDAKTAFEQAIARFLDRLDPDMSEYEMEKALHDMLAVQVTYVSGDNAHNAYGALVEGKAVCEGYAEALQCLLQRVGIQSVEVFGESRGENHAWNMVRIDGKYYLVDLTWNDQDTILLYAYFNQTTAVFNEDHLQWVIGYKNGKLLGCEVFKLPTCTATAANYFTKEGLRINTYTVESIGKLMKDNGLSISVFVEGSPDAFVAWYEKNVTQIATEAGVTGSFMYGNLQIGREVRIYFDTCEHTELELVAAKAATCEEDGNAEYYVCKNEECGKWFTLEVDSEGEQYKVEIMNRESVKVFSIGHDWSLRNTADEKTLKQKATNCQESDTYWYVCASCGEMSDVYTFTTVAGAHEDEDGDGVCDLCRDGESSFDVGGILDFIMENPLILGGGGGAIVLAIILAIISKARG